MYSTLEPREIRLLKILGLDSNGDICCKLSHALLTDRPNFIALSYAWGSAKLAKTIIVDNQEHRVTLNAYQFLRRIHQTFGGTTVWIDAICIDQNNQKEKEEQVQMMRDIYSSAAKAVIYLGEVQDSSLSMSAVGGKLSLTSIFFPGDATSGLMKTFEANCHSGNASNQRHPDDAINVFSLIQIMANAQTLEDVPPFDSISREVDQSRYQQNLFESLRQMIRSAWWNRMWTVQEAVVPRHIVIIYGCCATDWKTFARAAVVYSSKESPLSREYSTILDCFCRMVLDIEEMRAIWVRSGGAGTPLLSLLRKFTGRKASDDRDRIYALLGLARSPQIVCPIYSFSVPVAYRLAALQIIQDTGCLDVLNGDMGNKARQNLFSWIPDWAAEPNTVDQRRAKTVHLYRTSLRSFVYFDSFYIQFMFACIDNDSVTGLKEIAVSQTETHLKRLQQSLPYQYVPRHSPEFSPRYYADYISAMLETSEWDRYLRTGFESDPPNDNYDNYLLAARQYLQRDGTMAIARARKNGALELLGMKLFEVTFVGQANVTEWDICSIIQSWASDLASTMHRRADVLEPFVRTMSADILYANRGHLGRRCHRMGETSLPQVAAWLLHRPEAPLGAEAQCAEESPLHWFRRGLLTKYPDSVNCPRDENLDIDYSIRTATVGRSLFVAGLDTFGLCPPKTERGDLVCLLLGAKTPFVLRPTHDGRSKKYKLIGDCFVQGYMDGEAMALWRKLPDGKKDRRFHLV